MLDTYLSRTTGVNDPEVYNALRSNEPFILVLTWPAARLVDVSFCVGCGGSAIPEDMHLRNRTVRLGRVSLHVPFSKWSGPTVAGYGFATRTGCRSRKPLGSTVPHSLATTLLHNLPHARQKMMHENTGAQPRSYASENLVCDAAPIFYPGRNGEVAAWPATSFQRRRTQPWPSRFSTLKRRCASVLRGAARANEDCADEYN